MLRNCYKCYEIVKCQFSGLEIPRLPRYLICRLGLYTRGRAGSCELRAGICAWGELGELAYMRAKTSWKILGG